MKDSSAGARAFFMAFAVCCALFVTFLYFWFEVKLPFLQTDEFMLAAVSGVIALITVIIFQSFRVSVTASTLAEGMAKNMFAYSHELFMELYRSSPVPYLVLNKDLSVDSSNLAAVRLFGVDTAWFEGKDVFDYFKGENDLQLTLIREYFSKEVFVNNEEIEIVRPDGESRWVLLSLFSFKDAKKHHKGLLTLFDITKQKEIDRAKTEFVSLASHQLRTPITAMKWNVELLSAGKDHFSEAENTYVTKIKTGVERMDTLVAEFLSVSKLELGTFEAHPEEISLSSFMNGILESYEKNAEVKRIQIHRKWDEHDVFKADPHLLEMAVSNLVSNAVKYTREGGVVTITTEILSNTRLIKIADTGMGIPEKEQEHIFSKIFRASNAQAEVTDGTGLGLYIAREAMRVMKGDITFVSKEGEGTTFTVTLPHSV